MKKNLATLFVFPSLAVFVHQSNQLSFMGTINTQPELFCFYHKLGYMKLSFSLYFFYQKEIHQDKVVSEGEGKNLLPLEKKPQKCNEEMLKSFGGKAPKNHM